MDAVDWHSEEFKHKFLEMHKPWILQQLGGEIATPRQALQSMLEEEIQPWDIGAFARDDISSDSGSESDWDAAKTDKLELDPASKRIARAWLIKTRRRLGLPDFVDERADISSDSDSDMSDRGRKIPKMSAATRRIARLWLDAGAGLQMGKKAQVDVSSDDDDSESDGPRRGVAISAATREIATMWLAGVRKGPVSLDPHRNTAANLSTDSDSSSDEAGDFSRSKQVGAVTQSIAKMWLKRMRTRKGQGSGGLFQRVGPLSDTSDSDEVDAGRGRGQNLRRTRTIEVSDDDLSSSGEEEGEVSQQTQVRVSVKTKAIAQQWLKGVRRRR